MEKLSRRHFLKTGAAFLGAAAALRAAGAEAADKGGQPDKKAKTVAAPPHQVFAIKYAGPFVGKLAMVLWNEGWNEDIERNYYLWAAKSPKGRFTVVDAGTGPTDAAKRKLKNYVNPVEALKRVGANADNVDRVIITHIHFDHVGGMEVFPQAFPKAKFYVQKREFDFWVDNPIAKRKPFQGISDRLAIDALAKLKGTPRLVMVDGDRSLGAGIGVVLAPGHTPGLQGVSVSTAKGEIILASDCAHIHRSFVDDIPSCLIYDMGAWLKSYDKLRARVPLDRLFPGHDVKLLTDYPKAGEEVSRLA